MIVICCIQIVLPSQHHVFQTMNCAIMLQTPTPSNVTLPSDIDDRLVNLTHSVNRVEVSMRVSDDC